MDFSSFDRVYNTGIEALKKGKIDIALVHFSTAEEYLKVLGDTAETEKRLLDVLMTRSSIQEKLSEWDDAESDFRRALELAKKLSDPAIIVDCMAGLGKIKYQQGDLKEAKAIFEEGFSIATDHEMEDKYPAYHYHVGSTLAKLGESDKALMIFESGLRIAERVKADKNLIASINNQMGLLHFRMGMRDEAVPYYEESLRLLEGETENSTKAEGHRYLGIIFQIKRKYLEALEHYSEAIATYSKIRGNLGLAKTYGSVGQAYLKMGNITEALFFLEKSMALLEKLQARADLGMVYGKLGDAYVAKENYETAAQFYQKDIEMAEELKNTHGMAFSFLNLGRIYRIKKDWPLAEKYYIKSYEYFSSVQDQINVGVCFKELGYVYMGIGDYEKAVDHAKTAIEIFKSTQQPVQLASSQKVLAICFRTQQDWNNALELFNNVIPIFRQNNIKDDLAETYYELGQTYMDMRNRFESIKYLTKAFALAEELGNHSLMDNILHKIEKVDELELIRLSIRKLKGDLE